MFPSILVDECALRIMASRLKVTSHFGINGELSIISRDADTLVSSLTISFVYLKFGLNIFSLVGMCWVIGVIYESFMGHLVI